MNVIPADELEHAAAVLFAELDRIQIAPDGDMSPALAERTRRMGMLNALAEFVSSAWKGPNAIHATARLSELTLALSQLEDGVVHPLLEPRKRSGQFDRIDVWRGRAHVCFAVECYVRSHKYATRKSAAAAIAKPYLKSLMRRRMGRKKKAGTLPDAIISWHRQFQQGTANPLLQARWEQVLVPELNREQRPPEQMIDLGKYHLSVAKALAKSIIPPRSNP